MAAPRHLRESFAREAGQGGLPHGCSAYFFLFLATSQATSTGAPPEPSAFCGV